MCAFFPTLTIHATRTTYASRPLLAACYMLTFSLAYSAILKMKAMFLRNFRLLSPNMFLYPSKPAVEAYRVVRCYGSHVV
jgi:hypothetical protein